MMRRLKGLLPESVKHAIYRAPREQVLRLRSLGLAGYCLLDKWAAEMERSVAALPPLPACERGVDLWYLTGSRFWYQTAYCAWTFGWHAGRSVNLHLVDDGTLQPQQVGELERIFGRVSVVSSRESRTRLDALLPAGRYPVLRQRWYDYIHIRKLIDVHLGQHGPRLVLDSDMLFFARPQALLDWLDSDGERPLLYMTDCVESYGYSRPVLEELAGATLPVRLNVGICGMVSDRMDWPLIEEWSARLLAREGTSYYLEQALVAILAARTMGLQVPASDYITLPTTEQVRAGAGVLQHYVASAKADYFRRAWRLARAGCPV